MPRSCSICTHPQRQAIDQALMAGVVFRNIAQRFGTSTTAVHRHRHEHLTGLLLTPAPPEEISPPGPALSPEAQQALTVYRTAHAAYEQMRTQDWRRSPAAPDVLLTPLWLRVEAAQRRLQALGLDPDDVSADGSHT
jgi:hypothetical protein